MEFLLPLVTVAAVQLLAVISPGQSFVVISRLALSAGRAPAVAAALAMGVGSVLWATAAIAGLAIILEQAAWLYAAMKLAGGAYLLFLAVMLWRHAPDRLPTAGETSGTVSLRSAFTLGFLTQLANPKVVLFFSSIFYALLPIHAPLWVYVASIVVVFCNETVWYTVVSLAFSNQQSRDAYSHSKAWIDRGMSLALGTIGAKLVADAIGLRWGQLDQPS
jgi:threonine/homoserine/homoserine lactone efflux protein